MYLCNCSNCTCVYVWIEKKWHSLVLDIRCLQLVFWVLKYGCKMLTTHFFSLIVLSCWSKRVILLLVFSCSLVDSSQSFGSIWSCSMSAFQWMDLAALFACQVDVSIIIFVVSLCKCWLKVTIEVLWRSGIFNRMLSLLGLNTYNLFRSLLLCSIWCLCNAFLVCWSICFSSVIDQPRTLKPFGNGRACTFVGCLDSCVTVQTHLKDFCDMIEELLLVFFSHLFSILFNWFEHTKVLVLVSDV